MLTLSKMSPTTSLAEHATTILDPDRSRIVIIDFVDNPITDRISPIHAKSVR